MENGRRTYHGRRGPTPVVWVIALVVLIAAVVLVVVGLAKHDAIPPQHDDTQQNQPNTPDDNTQKPEEPDNTDDPNTADDPAGTTDNTGDDPAQTASDEPYIDATGLLQYSTKGHYVQMDSYQGGGQPDWQLLLVNDWNPLPSGYDSDVSFTTVTGGKQMDSRITDIVEQMLRDASAYDLAVVSAYRPKEEQNTLYWRKVKQYTDKGYSDLEAQKVGGTIVKRPGFSEHNCGLAMDVGGSGDYTLEQTFANTAAYTWLMEHCADYGFILRFPEGKEDITGVIYEPWHYRYVGVPHATYMMENNLCLEEYLELLKNSYAYPNEPLTVSADGTEYLIYYVPVSADSTTFVPVPPESVGTYEISGNNVDGFIVTVTKK